jgi:uncharacterized membrane protein
MPEDEKNEVEEQVEKVSPNGGGDGKSALSRLMNKDTLIPVAAAAATAAAAGLVAKKGPDVKSKIAGQAKDGAEELGGKAAEGAKEQITGGGGVGSMLGGAAKLIPGIGGGGGGGKKKTRRLPIQRWTDIAVSRDVVYEKWTQFEDFPKFMHRVLSVQQKDDDTVIWEEKIWFSKRKWQGKITDKRKNDRIAWTTESGTAHTGIVTFHELDKNLTRVLVTVDFQPSGMLEKMASGLRFVKRAVQSDLARFKAYVELGEAEGVEYESVPSEDDQADQKDDQGDEQDEQRAEQDDGSGDDDSEDREAEREEREARRKERRESARAA